MTVKLKVSTEEARKRIETIPHKSCVKAIDENWKVDQDGVVRAQSVFWLFCWAKTGMNSEQARQTSMRVFDEILSCTFADVDAVVEHAYARKARYIHASGKGPRDADKALKQICEQINLKQATGEQSISYPHNP